MEIYGRYSFANITRGSLLDSRCPALLLRRRTIDVSRWRYRDPLRLRDRWLHSNLVASPHLVEGTSRHLLDLPISCPGCGAYAQCSAPKEPGFYSSHSKSVKDYLARNDNASQSRPKESELFRQAVGAATADVRSQLGLDGEINSKPGHNLKYFVLLC